MFDIVFKNSTADKKYNSKFFEEILIVAVRELKLKNKNISLSVNLVGESEIRKLNKKYRHKDKVTDVLSFPMIHDTRYMTHDTDVGDIFVCLSIAKKQAKSENIDIRGKLARLTVHGFLHLLGYDHEKSAKDAKKMFDLENKILKNIRTQSA